MSYRRTALITGASGGMGRACARLFGASHDLLLTDVAGPALDRFAEELSKDGYSISAARSGSIGDAGLVEALVDDLSGSDPFVLVHTAAVSPSQADWRTILEVDLIASVRLLNAVEPVLRPGSVGVLIASLAGHMAAVDPQAAALCADPVAPGFIDSMERVVLRAAGDSPAGAPGPAYSYAKQGLIALAERRAVAWGARGARLVSISPGVIATPMGHQEMEAHPDALRLATAVPAGRTGTAAEIAQAARFLASDEASFITGCDLKVDGGAVAFVRHAAAAAA
ncbi:SDR family oxidoreductase [Sphingobium tyrosinilyticum]|uniref:SDR family oxidoreductase n=1 Tax=Sphingobium tyrosinilyticum TaxID=2715436 RepID=A0ABV9F1K5_9SPHN